MKKGLKEKAVKLGLVGALAIGGLGVGAAADLPVPGLKAEQASAATFEDYVFFVKTPETGLIETNYFVLAKSNQAEIQVQVENSFKDVTAVVNIHREVNGVYQLVGTVSKRVKPYETVNFDYLLTGKYDTNYRVQLKYYSQVSSDLILNTWDSPFKVNTK